MARETEFLTGAAGRLEVVVDRPAGTPLGIALVAHPHPLMGGTLDNKVAQTLARACTDAGCIAWRPNFRGVGSSEGEHAAGAGETDDLCLLVDALRARHPGLPLFLAGFSFGAFVQARVAARLAAAAAGAGAEASTAASGGPSAARRLILVGTAVQRFDVPPVPAGTLLIHGEQDEVITLAQLLDWARPQDLPVLVLPGADHFFHRRLHLIRQAVVAALHDALRQPAG